MHVLSGLGTISGGLKACYHLRSTRAKAAVDSAGGARGGRVAKGTRIVLLDSNRLVNRALKTTGDDRNGILEH